MKENYALLLIAQLIFHSLNAVPLSAQNNRDIWQVEVSSGCAPITVEAEAPSKIIRCPTDIPGPNTAMIRGAITHPIEYYWKGEAWNNAWITCSAPNGRRIRSEFVHQVSGTILGVKEEISTFTNGSWCGLSGQSKRVSFQYLKSTG
ncbi:MAG: hypothetical protein AAF734_01640, partial [Bacteroidota bacterium]